MSERNQDKAVRVEKYDPSFARRVGAIIAKTHLNRTGGLAFGVIAKALGVSTVTVLKWRTPGHHLFKPDFLEAVNATEAELRKKIERSINLDMDIYKKRHKRSGQPVKYKPEYEKQGLILCMSGFIDSQIAEFYGVCEQTINNWKKLFPEFREALKRGKIIGKGKRRRIKRIGRKNKINGKMVVRPIKNE